MDMLLSSVLRHYRKAECNAAGVPLDFERCDGCYGGTGLAWWKCGDCNANNRGADAFCHRCGSGAPEDGPEPCERCAGFGCLKAAAIEARRLVQAGDEVMRRWGDQRTFEGMSLEVIHEHAVRFEALRQEVHETWKVCCEDCFHPMGDAGFWEREGSDQVPYGAPDLWAISQKMWLDAMRKHGDDRVYQPVHWSPCSALCRHGGPMRFRNLLGGWENVSPLGPIQAQAATDRAAWASWREVDLRLLDWPHDLSRSSVAVLCLRCYVERLRAGTAA
ncbi:MAG: hypothetical protein ABW167_07755 [Baekduia sp.]